MLFPTFLRDLSEVPLLRREDRPQLKSLLIGWLWDKFQRMVISNQQVKAQHIHEMKKKEKDYIKLQSLMMNVGFSTLIDSFVYLIERRGSAGPGTVDAYEAKNQELMAENTNLRAILRSMQADMGSANPLLAGSEKREANHSQSPLGGKTDVFDLPFRMARGQIEESLRTKMASIKNVWSSYKMHLKEHLLHLKQQRESLNSKLSSSRQEASSKNRLTVANQGEETQQKNPTTSPAISKKKGAKRTRQAMPQGSQKKSYRYKP